MSSKHGSTASLACAVACALLSAAPQAQAANVFEIGAGWQDTGAIEGSLEWTYSIQGSRKDVPAYVGWRHLGQRRFYWAPFARFNYTNFWSIAGSGNLLGVTIAPLGGGVYLSRPPSAERRGRWFATLELNIGSFAIGGNVTPDAPIDSRIPDPNAYRAQLRAEVQQQGGVMSSITQFYPFGPYSFVSLNVPIQIRVWRMVNDKIGAGGFIEGYPLMLEWRLGGGASSTPAYGYNVNVGLTVILF
jgi:hypothetical protein